MCGIAAAIGLAAGALKLAGDVQSANQQADYQTKVAQARNAQIEANNIATMESYNRQMQQEGLRVQQERAKASEAIAQKQQEGRAKRATALVSAGESGITGLSVEQLLADFRRGEAHYNDLVNQNLDMLELQSQYNQQAMQSQAQGRLNSIQPYIPSPIQQPSVLSAGLYGVQTGLSLGKAFSDYRTASTPVPSPSSWVGKETTLGEFDYLGPQF